MDQVVDSTIEHSVVLNGKYHITISSARVPFAGDKLMSYFGTPYSYDGAALMTISGASHAIRTIQYAFDEKIEQIKTSRVFTDSTKETMLKNLQNDAQPTSLTSRLKVLKGISMP
jgi:hypothetical protein